MVRYDFEGRLVIVTGGAGALGLAIARLLIASNARVEIWDRSPSALDAAATGLGMSVSFVCVDVTDVDSVRSAAATTDAMRGPIFALVNNAGILGPVAPSWEVDPETFRRVVDVNLTGAFVVSGAVVPLMLAAGVAGRIVNVASTQGKEGTVLASAYAASKAGLIALTKTLGKELATTGILVNAVAPTAADGAMADGLSPERGADLLARIPMARFVEPDEVAAQVIWLCSDACSFATGAVFDISGGRATY